VEKEKRKKKCVEKEKRKMHVIFENALSVFIGIMLTIIVLWIITTIVCLIFQDKFFSKERQEQFKNDINNYMRKPIKEKDKEKEKENINNID
jgi:uncharacterized membrane protein (DUF106 family)